MLVTVSALGFLNTQAFALMSDKLAHHKKTGLATRMAVKSPAVLRKACVVPGSLFDTSVWLAAVFTRPPFHESARKALREATASHPAVFCRATQQSFLQLASTPTLFKAYGVRLGYSGR